MEWFRRDWIHNDSRRITADRVVRGEQLSKHFRLSKGEYAYDNEDESAFSPSSESPDWSDCLGTSQARRGKGLPSGVRHHFRNGLRFMLVSRFGKWSSEDGAHRPCI